LPKKSTFWADFSGRDYYFAMLIFSVRHVGICRAFIDVSKTLLFYSQVLNPQQTGKCGKFIPLFLLRAR